MTSTGSQVAVDQDASAMTEIARRDRERRKRVLKHCRGFLLQFASLVRQLLYHDEGNAAVRSMLESMEVEYLALQKLSGPITVVFTQGHTFANGVWIRVRGRAWEASVFMTETLLKLGARGFVLYPGCSREELMRFTQFLRKAHGLAEPIDEPVEDVGLPGVRLILTEKESDELGSRAAFRKEVVDVFKEGLLAIHNGAENELDVFMRRRQRALVTRLVKMAEDSPEDVLTLTTLRDPTLPPQTHNLMVAVLAVCLGRAMDLRRRDLVRLGVAALNHNVGESLLPPGVLAQKRELDAHEREIVESHPLIGVRHLLENYGFELPILERALVAGEHHLYEESSGYPQIARTEPHIFSRLVSVADVFNALTHDRPHRDGYPPDQAVKLIRRGRAAKLHPLLVRMLIRVVGRYPPGSLVELDTGEYAVVLGVGKGASPLQRPRVLLLTSPDGYELDEYMVVDLGERHLRRRAWLRTIVRTKDPSLLPKSVASYLLADRLELEPGKLDSEG